MYGLIYADPPWPQSKGNFRQSRPKQNKKFDYKTMSVDDCFATMEPFFAQADEKHNVFIWTIDKFLHETEQEMQKRGYKLHARFIWDKENGVAPAFTVRFSHEYLLWFHKQGQMLRPVAECRGKYTTVMHEKATYHSHKPQCAYEMLEDMFPEAVKIELFARDKRLGWYAMGDELECN